MTLKDDSPLQLFSAQSPQGTCCLIVSSLLSPVTLLPHLTSFPPLTHSVYSALLCVASGT